MKSNELDSPISHDHDINIPLPQQVSNKDIVGSPHPTDEPVSSDELDGPISHDHHITSPRTQQVINKDIFSSPHRTDDSVCSFDEYAERIAEREIVYPVKRGSTWQIVTRRVCKGKGNGMWQCPP